MPIAGQHPRDRHCEACDQPDQAQRSQADIVMIAGTWNCLLLWQYARCTIFFFGHRGMTGYILDTAKQGVNGQCGALNELPLIK